MSREWTDPITGVPVLSLGTVAAVGAQQVIRAAAEAERQEQIRRKLSPLDHIVCCEPTRALCGADVKDEPLVFSTEPAKDAKNPCPECWNKASDNVRCQVPMCPGNDRPD
jgi:hypothetical protein